MTQRVLALRGAQNFRDLGGYPTPSGETAWGRVFRSARLTNLSEDDVALLLARGLRTVVDLRTIAEVGRAGSGLLAGKVERLHHSLLTPSLVLRPALDYTDWTQAAVRPLTAIFARMTGPVDPFPLVFHCSVGKDRTGILAALLLSALGCPREVIVADYALTRQHFNPSGDQVGKWRRRVLRHFPGVPAERSRQLLDADPDTMATFLDTLASRNGSIAAFLEKVGVRAPQQAILRARLLRATKPATEQSP